jgi:hypothetical protein
MLLDDHRVLAPYVDAEALIYRRRVCGVGLVNLLLMTFLSISCRP